MKIIFQNGYAYNINAIEFEKDEEGNPIDIIIAADEQTLENLTTMAMIGCNIREMNVEDKFYGRASHIGLYARLCPFEVFSDEESTPATLNNCDELIEFVCNELPDYPDDIIVFQGDTLEVTKTDLTYEEFGIIRDNTLISISSSAEGFFDLHAVKSPMSFNDKFPCIVMPNYVREELIATLKGEW